MALHPATIAAHTTAIAALAGATTTTQLAAALNRFQNLDIPGFPNDLPDGDYYDGFFFATKHHGDLAVTQHHQLPVATRELWAQLDDEHRAAADRAIVLADLDAERRGPGRPPVGKPLPVRLPDWRRRIITADAAAVGVKDAELIRWLVGEAYAELDRAARAAGTDRTDLIRVRMNQTRRTH